MFTKHYTVILDACVLCSPLKRNIIASFAEMEIFRIRWSDKIMDETEKAVAIILTKREYSNPTKHAENVRSILNEAFKEATVAGYENLEKTIGKIPDEGDRHVIAAAIKTQANVIVTENLKDFPRRALSKHGIEARSSDVFIADAINYNPSIAMASIKQMLQRLGKQEDAAEALLLNMERCGLTQTAEQYRENIKLT